MRDRMVATRIRQAAQKAGIKSGYQLTKVLGVSPSMGARLWKDDVSMIALSTIEKLCGVLRCEPKDLFTYRKVASRTKVKR